MLLFWLDSQQCCGSALFLEAGSGSASEKLDRDPDPHLSQNGAVEAQNGDVEAQNGALEGLPNIGIRFPSL
jgi:hypothetical protein